MIVSRLKGQSIVEILIAVAVGAVLVIAGSALIIPALTTNKNVGKAQAVAVATKELADNVRVWSENDWHSVVALATGTGNPYYLNTAHSPFSVVPGIESITVSGQSIMRYFYLSDSYRTASGTPTSTVAGNTYDPSTKQVTVVVIPPTTASSSPLSFATSSWTNTTPFPSAPNVSSFDSAWTSLVSTNGYIYALGGVPVGITATTTVWYAKITGNGTVGNWSVTTAMPSTWLGVTNAVAYNGYVYLLDGGDSTHATTTVYYAKSNANGTLGAWTATTNLPGVFNQGTLFAYNNFLYVVGSFNTAYSWFAPINASGTIGAWTQTVAAPGDGTGNTVDWSLGATYNGYFYIPGGFVSGAPSNTSTVWYTHPNATGSLAAWQTSTPLPVPLEGTPIAYNGYLYVLAGDSVGQTVYSAPLNTDGTVGAWTQGTSLPNAGTGYPLFDFVQAGNSIYTVLPQSTTVRAFVMPLPPGGTSFSMFVTRNANHSFDQTDWSGGPGDAGPVSVAPNDFNAASSTILYKKAGSLSLQTMGNISFVQGAANQQTLTVNTSFSSLVGRHNLLIVAIAFTGSVTGPGTVTSPGAGGGGGGGNYVLATTTKTTNGDTVEIFYQIDAPNPGENVQYQNTFSGPVKLSMVLAEFNNQGLFDGSIGASGSGTTTNSGNITPTGSGRLVLGAMTHENAASTTFTGFSLANDASDDPSIGKPLALEFKTNAGSGAVSSSFGLSPGDKWAQLTALFSGGGSLVQNKSIFFTTPQVTSVTAPLTSSVAGHDLLVVSAAASTGTLATSAVTDTLGNSFTQIGSTLTSGGGGRSAVYYAVNNATGTDSVTFTNSTATDLTLMVGEFTNIDPVNPFDTFAGATDSSTLSTTSLVNLNSSQANELLIGAGTYSVEGLVTAGPGFSFAVPPARILRENALEYKVLPGTTSRPASSSFTYQFPTNWTLHGALFNPQVSVLASGTLESAIFDTGVASGAQLNSVLWKGTQPAGTAVGFQFAAATSTAGPWNYQGSDGTSASFYLPAKNVGASLNYAPYNNFRYFRYKVTLFPDATLTVFPTITDIVVNWSP